MESEAGSADRRNQVLAQLYTQGLGRVAQQSNDVGFSFELPKEVVEKREKEWGNLFAKYTEHSSDDIELDINTMDPVATEEEEEDKGEDVVDEESGEYYSKCRAPMRKLPALVQYWIDTGNPPYQLVGDDDHSETGSSLSEGEHSRTGHSDVLRESSDKQRPEDVSPYSSVDTAAYILSNTNVTKKSETMAIVEGAKKPEVSKIPTVSPRKDKVIAENNAAIGSKNNSLLSTEQEARSIKNLMRRSPAPPSPRKPIAEDDFRTFDNNFQSPNGSPRLFSPSQRSVKLSEVLPTFCQFDELSDVSRATRPAGAHSSLSTVGRNSKLVVSSPNDETPPAQTSSILPNNLIKPHNRRKLYTGRNSPVDLTLTVERTFVGSVQKTGNCLHPALEPETTEKQKTLIFPNRARARKKRKSASQAGEFVGNGVNTSHDSVPSITTEKVKGDMRYSDFFESLGLTPSKTIIGETPVSKPVRKRPRKIDKRVKPRKPKEKFKFIDGTDTSVKQTGETSVFSPLGPRFSVNDAASKLPVDKILVVRLNRLSDDFLARYKRRGDSDEGEKNLENAVVEKAPDIATSSSGSSPVVDKKGKASHTENIELLTTATHDSDSSTILICSCNNDNNEQCSDSDNSLFTKDRSNLKKKSFVVENVRSPRSLRSAENKSPVKTNAVVTTNLEQPTNESQKSKINKDIENSPKNASNKTVLEISSKLPRVLVRLDKLEPNDMPKTILHNNNNNNSNNNNNNNNNNNHHHHQNASDFTSSTKSFVQAGGQVDFPGFSSSGRSPEAKNKRVAIGSRETNDFDKNPVKLEKHRSIPVRCSLRISIPSGEEEEEEDRFAKLVKEFGSARRSVKIETDESKKISGDELVDDTNDDSVTVPKSQMSTRLRSNYGIFMSSDDEEDEPKKPAKKVRSKRRGKLERNAGTANETDYRKKKIVNHSLNLDEFNRRKDSSIDKRHENFQVDAKAREVVRRSTRNKKSLTPGDSGERFEDYERLLFSIPKNTRTMFVNAKESNLDDDKASLPFRDNRRPESTSDKSGANSTSQFSKSKSRKSLFSKVTQSGRYGKISVRSSLNLTRFKTRFDSDSDTDFETLRFSVDSKNDQRSDKARASVKQTQTEKSNTEVSDRNVPTRSFQTLIDRTMELSGKKLILAETSVKNTSDDSQKNSTATKNGSWTDPSDRFDESVKTRHSRTKQKNIKPTTVPQTKNSSERSSSKLSIRRSTPLPISCQPNYEQFSAIAKENLTSTRLFGTPVEYESDDDVKLADGKANSDEKLRREKFVFPNSTSAKKKIGEQSSSRKRRGEQLSSTVKKKQPRIRLVGTPVEYESDDDGEPTDGKVERSGETSQRKKLSSPNSTSSKKIIDEHDSSRKRRTASKKLFSNSPEEEEEEEEDGAFNDSLKLVSGSKHRNLNNVRRSTMIFRTKLRSDSDDDDDDDDDDEDKAARVTSSSDNRLSSRDEFATFDESVRTKHSHTKQKNMKPTTVRQIKNSSERSSSKLSLRRSTSFPISCQPNDDQFSPIAKKNLTRTRLLGNPVEYESDDDVKLADGKADSDEKHQREKFVFSNSTSAKKKSGEQSSSTKRRAEQSSPTVKKKPRFRLLGTPVECESDDDGEPTAGKVERSGETSRRKHFFSPNSTSSKKIIDEHDSSSKCRKASKKLFSNSPEENGVLVDSSEFVSGSKHGNLNNARRSTMIFRTKLRLDSDDDEDKVS